MDGSINPQYITDYLNSLIPPSKGILSDLEEYVKENYVPIVSPEVAQLLRLLVNINKPKRVLEVGTAIGYSAILIANSMNNEGEILTIERYDKMASLARENIKNAGLENTVKVLEGEAIDLLSALEGSFDFVFLDAAKGQYPDFLPHLLRLLKKGGLLVSDNVLYKGMVAERKLLVRRKITIVKRLQKYLKIISEHPELSTSVIPIGDGVAVSLKI